MSRGPLQKVRDSGPVWSALAVEVRRKMSEFVCAEVSMTLWAVATGGMVHGSCPSFEMGRVVTRRRVAEFSNTRLANVSWAFAKCGQPGADERDLFASIRALARECKHLSCSMCLWQLSPSSGCWPGLSLSRVFLSCSMRLSMV